VPKTTVTGNGVIDFIIVLGIVSVLSGFVWDNTTEVAGLRADMLNQTKTNDIQSMKIETNSQRQNDVKSSVDKNSVHLVHIRDSIQKIEVLLKDFYTRK